MVSNISYLVDQVDAGYLYILNKYTSFPEYTLKPRVILLYSKVGTDSISLPRYGNEARCFSTPPVKDQDVDTSA